MKISSRADQISPSPTLAIKARAAQMKKQGIDVISILLILERLLSHYIPQSITWVHLWRKVVRRLTARAIISYYISDCDREKPGILQAAHFPEFPIRSRFTSSTFASSSKARIT